MAEPTKTLFGMWTRVGPRNHVLDGGPYPPCKMAILRGKGAAHCKVLGLSAVSSAKTAEPIEMPFGIWTLVGPRKHVLGGDAHWRHLKNTIEPSMCGGDAACCQITLATCIFRPHWPYYVPTYIVRPMWSKNIVGQSVCHTSEPCKKG